MGILEYDVEQIRQRAANIDRLRNEGWSAYQKSAGDLLNLYRDLLNDSNDAAIVWVQNLTGWNVPSDWQGGNDRTSWNYHVGQVYNEYYAMLAQSLRDAADAMEALDNALATGWKPGTSSHKPPHGPH